MSKYLPVRPYQPVDEYSPMIWENKKQHRLNHQVQWMDDMNAMLNALDLFDGMTVSFHHHLRNGDAVLNMVMEAIAQRGYKDLTVVASSIFPVHQPLVAMLRDKTVTQIITSYMSGPVAKAVSEGECEATCVLQTHGGRARSILMEDVCIDIAFIASPSVNHRGDISGQHGKNACGALGYVMADALMAKNVIAISDSRVEFDAPSIEYTCVDMVLMVDSIGSSSGIVSGTTQLTKDPAGLKIAHLTVDLLDALGLVKNGLTYQSGAGGISLAVTTFLKEKMKQKQVVGEFASGGITRALVEMHEEGLFNHLYDVQCFDLDAVESLKKNVNHHEISASMYANPNQLDNKVNQLDVVILGASEIDRDMNVNVTTGFDYQILGGSGGHADTSYGATWSIIVSKLVSSRIPVLVDRVTTITTPKDDIDIFVCDVGIAFAKRHQALSDTLKQTTRLPIVTMDELAEISEKLCGKSLMIEHESRVVAVSEYRDGSLLDVIYQKKKGD